MLAAVLGGAAGPWLAGRLHDHFGDYSPAFWASIGLSVISAAAIWLAAPRKVRVVVGRTRSMTAG
jgi:cyanate permease